jgi:DNA topoisomerase I
MLDQTPSQAPAEESLQTARAAGLYFVTDANEGIRRKRCGKGFRYVLPSGAALKERAELARIRKLAIPPAWSNVWICPSPDGHIQATGRDARGRKQYRYHPDWIRVRDEAKYDKLLTFARVLPRLRKTVQDHMGERGLTRNKVLATVVYLLETTLVRVGNREYAKENKSYGLTTLQDRHVSFEGSAVRFSFRGKTGKEWKLKVTDRRIARIVRSCQDLPGQHLFQYENEAGEACQVTSADVNEYLREITGEEITAKDFRTWAGTVLAAVALSEFERFDSETAAKRNIRAAIEAVAARLGNTTSICRKCYVHPEVLKCYLNGTLLKTLKKRIRKELGQKISMLRPEEAATLVLLENGLKKVSPAEGCHSPHHSTLRSPAASDTFTLTA